MLAIAKLPVQGNCLAYHPEGNVVAVGSMVGELMLMQFSVETGTWTPVARRAIGPKAKGWWLVRKKKNAFQSDE